jgi:hypothetical protein
MPLNKAEYENKERTLKPLLQRPGFLTTLTEAAKMFGWDGDYIEVESFVKYCFDLAGLPRPDLTPYDIEGF